MVCDEFKFQDSREGLFPKRETEKKDVSSGSEAFSCFLFEFCVVDWCLPYFELALCWHVCFFPIQANQKRYLLWNSNSSLTTRA